MTETEYKNAFNDEHYDRINFSVPKGIKQAIKEIASQNGLSMNKYFLELVKKDQAESFSTMQLSERSINMILMIRGDTQNGYTVILKDGRKFYCERKVDIRKLFSQHLAQDK